jgi:hypothetical protein
MCVLQGSGAVLHLLLRSRQPAVSAPAGEAWWQLGSSSSSNSWVLVLWESQALAFACLVSWVSWVWLQ